MQRTLAVFVLFLATAVVAPLAFCQGDSPMGDPKSDQPATTQIEGRIIVLEKDVADLKAHGLRDDDPRVHEIERRLAALQAKARKYRAKARGRRTGVLGSHERRQDFRIDWLAKDRTRHEAWLKAIAEKVGVPAPTAQQPVTKSGFKSQAPAGQQQSAAPPAAQTPSAPTPPPASSGGFGGRSVGFTDPTQVTPAIYYLAAAATPPTKKETKKPALTIVVRRHGKEAAMSGIRFTVICMDKSENPDTDSQVTGPKGTYEYYDLPGGKDSVYRVTLDGIPAGLVVLGEQTKDFTHGDAAVFHLGTPHEAQIEAIAGVERRVGEAETALGERVESAVTAANAAKQAANGVPAQVTQAVNAGVSGLQGQMVGVFRVLVVSLLLIVALMVQTYASGRRVS